MSVDRKARNFVEPIEHVSLDAPPLDFSFRNIKTLEQLLTAAPRQGQRKQIVVQPEEGKDKKLAKQESGLKEVPKQEEGSQEVQKKAVKKAPQVIRLVPQNNINALINTLVTNANLKNVLLMLAQISGSNNDDKNLEKKKAVKVRLECVSLVLGYNKLASIAGLHNTLTQIMPNFSKLQWLDLSHNHLTLLDYNFQELPLVRTLYLHCNYLYDMNNLSQLAKLQNLKTMTIHGNPIATVGNFRVYIIGLLPHLKKLDSVVVSKKERDNSNFFTKALEPGKYPIPKNYAKPPVEDLEKNENQYS